MAGATTSLLLAGAAASSAVSSVGGAISQANALQMQGDYQRNIYNLNAKMADFQGADAIRRGEKDAKEVLRASKGAIGAQRAAIAAQGIEVDSGSAVDIQGDTAAAAAEAALKIKNNAWREAWGYKVQALEASSKGEFAGLSASSNAAQTILTGGSQAIGYGIKAWAYGKGYKET